MHTGRAKKRFGQNFLRDDAIIHQIIHAIAPKSSQNIVEIGAGDGTLTQHLLPNAQHYDAIEIDRDLLSHLNSLKTHFPTLNIHHQDVLQFDFSTIQTPFRLVGNLPYNISTPLLLGLTQFKHHFCDAHFMLQKEVAERITACPGNRAYGRLSVVLQYHFQIDLLFYVPPTAFIPQPKVESAIVRLAPYATPPYFANDENQFRTLVKQAFSQPRKTLRNNLKHLITDAHWQMLAIDPAKRPEQLSVASYVKISNIL